jgi:hypothetical protein
VGKPECKRDFVGGRFRGRGVTGGFTESYTGAQLADHYGAQKPSGAPEPTASLTPTAQEVCLGSMLLKKSSWILANHDSVV